jgi:5-methylcytosine-specific restriction endonuclease McrA
MSSVLTKERRPTRTLVLNADYLPLSTWPPSLISCENAVHALYRDRVTVVDTWPGYFMRSPSVSIPVPRIVALRHYAPVAGEPKFCRRSVYLRDRYRCQYCGAPFPTEELTLDHVIPRANGGKTVWENILACCVGCNSKKGHKPANFSGRRGVVGADGSMRPLKQPRRPTRAELLRAGLELLPADIKNDFGDWLYWDAELQP